MVAQAGPLIQQDCIYENWKFRHRDIYTHTHTHTGRRPGEGEAEIGVMLL